MNLVENKNGELQSDYCIVGGGVAGLFLAYQLGKLGKEVVVLEAGSRDPVGDWRKLVWYKKERDYTECVTDYPYNVEWSWIKTLGGGTEAWEGYTPRFVPSDFSLNSKFGVGVDWPVGYSELEPDYCKAERFLGVSGLADNPHDGMRSDGFPLPPFEFDVYEREITSRVRTQNWHHVPQARNSIGYHGRSACNTIGTCNSCPSQARWTPSGTLIPRLGRMSNVRIFCDANVTRICSDAGGRATAVQVDASNGNLRKVSFDRLILCGGAVETSRLLLLSSTSQFPEGFLNSNKLVGKGFMDHPVLRVCGDTDWSFEKQVQTNILASCHDFRQYDKDSGGWGFIVNLNSRRRGKLWMAAHFEMPPVESNNISLSNDMDYGGRRFGKLAMTMDWEGFENTTKRMRNVLLDLARQAGGKNLQFDPLQLWACHPMGGLVFGRSPKNSILDDGLKAWDSPNTYILSLGVFPTGAAVNPTLTLLALGYRLVRRLMRE